MDEVELLAASSVAEPDSLGVHAYVFIDANALDLLPLGVVEAALDVLQVDLLRALGTFDWEQSHIVQDRPEVVLQTLQTEQVRTPLHPVRLLELLAADPAGLGVHLLFLHLQGLYDVHDVDRGAFYFF